MFAKPLIYSCRVCLLDWAHSAGPRFPGEPRVPLARVCNFNGHQASFQAERGAGGGGGRAGWRRVMKTIHLVTSLTERESELLDVTQKRLSWCVVLIYALAVFLEWLRMLVKFSRNLGDRVQEMPGEPTGRTSSWLRPSPKSTAPLRSTGSLEKRPRSRRPGAKRAPLYYLLLPYVITVLLFPTPPHTRWDHTLTILTCMNFTQSLSTSSRASWLTLCSYSYASVRWIVSTLLSVLLISQWNFPSPFHSLCKLCVVNVAQGFWHQSERR